MAPLGAGTASRPSSPTTPSDSTAQSADRALPHSSFSSAASVASDASGDDTEAYRTPSNPLRTLLFHSQQLSLLMYSTAALPDVLSNLMSVFGSGSNGVSLSSLVAFECLTRWRLQDQCWMAVLAPALIGFLALLARTYDRWHRHHGADPFAMGPYAQRAYLLAQRIFGVCVSLLYVLVFPCATVALTALGCTDRSEVTTSTSRVFLNLRPYVQCDAEWRHHVLPPAMLAALFWCVAFPLTSTLLLRKHHRRVMAVRSASGRRLSMSATPAAVLRTHRHASQAWRLSSALLEPYLPKFWYMEQVLLARRLLLATVVSVVPSESLYLPLLLLSIIQLSALVQHWTLPYRSAWLNFAELTSLYLLLLNYTAALVVQSSVSSNDGAQDNSGSLWLVALFALNLLFLLGLIGGLFAVVRSRAAAVLAPLVVCMRRVLSRISNGSGKGEDVEDDGEDDDGAVGDSDDLRLEHDDADEDIFDDARKKSTININFSELNRPFLE